MTLVLDIFLTRIVRMGRKAYSRSISEVCSAAANGNRVWCWQVAATLTARGELDTHLKLAYSKGCPISIQIISIINITFNCCDFNQVTFVWTYYSSYIGFMIIFELLIFTFFISKFLMKTFRIIYKILKHYTVVTNSYLI